MGSSSRWTSSRADSAAPAESARSHARTARADGPASEPGDPVALTLPAKSDSTARRTQRKRARALPVRSSPVSTERSLRSTLRDAARDARGRAGRGKPGEEIRPVRAQARAPGAGSTSAPFGGPQSRRVGLAPSHPRPAGRGVSRARGRECAHGGHLGASGAAPALA